MLGGLTVWFHNPTFIKWKPSAVCWAMALVLLVSQLLGKNLLRTWSASSFTCRTRSGSGSAIAWILFLTLSGVANLYVAYTFSTSTWVSFKVVRPDRPECCCSSSPRASTSRATWRTRSRRPRGRCADKAAAGRDEAGLSVAAADIEAALRAALAPTALEVEDDSHLHVGHAGAREGRHFSVRIASPRFKGLTPVARHRLVYDALHALMPRGIHALAIDARVPDES